MSKKGTRGSERKDQNGGPPQEAKIREGRWGRKGRSLKAS